MRKQVRIEIRLFVLIVIGFLILAAIILFHNHHKNDMVGIKESYIHELKDDYEITLGVYTDMADLIYHFFIDVPEIKEIFAQGVKSRDPEEKDRYRTQLYDRLSDLYQSIIQYNFRQLHFHEKNNASYLRFHRPGKYGDDLTGVRYSVEYANSKKKYIYGFEEGRIFNGYRFVYPIFFHDEHIGSVEVSVSMNTVIHKIKERYNSGVQFIIQRSEVESKLFENEYENYVPWCIDSDYVMDREIAKECNLKSKLTEKNAKKIRREFVEKSVKDSSFIIESVVDGEFSVLTFLPIKNIMGQNVAFIIEIFSGEDIADHERDYYFVIISLIILFILLVLFALYYWSSQNKIERMATFDSLTGAYARGTLRQLIQNEYERYKRYQKPFSLIMVDIDHFKNINDIHGHSTGDIVLSGITSMMNEYTRKSDFIGRYGGEEFIVLLPETKKENAINVAEKLRQMISTHEFEGVGIVTVSCGVVEMFKQAESIDELINAVDEKLYTAKRNGRNRVES